MAAQSPRRSKLYSSSLSAKHRPVEEEVAFKDLVVGERYNVTEKHFVGLLPQESKRKSKSKERDESRHVFKLTTFSGEFLHQNIDSIEFKNVVNENKKKIVVYGIPKSDVHIITKLVFPGLANELVRRVHGFTKKNHSNYKRFTTMTKLSPGDDLIDMDGNHIRVNTNQFVGPSGVYKGRPVTGYRKKPKASGGKNTRKNN
jgi:hypothetical protein